MYRYLNYIFLNKSFSSFQFYFNTLLQFMERITVINDKDNVVHNTEVIATNNMSTNKFVKK